MDRVSVSIGARLWQIPSLEGQLAFVKLVRGGYNCLLDSFTTWVICVLGWVFRSTKVDVRMGLMLESHSVSKLAFIGFSRPPHLPTPPHLSSNGSIAHLLNVYAFQDPRSVVTLQGGYLARQWWFTYSLFLITIFLITNSPLSAQTPYTGGSGDGHAMGELVLRTVSVAELSSENGYAIYPSLAKPNEAIYITSPAVGEFLLVDLSGRTVIRETLAQPVSQLPIVVTGPGSYIAILRTAEGTFTQKIMVIE